MELIWALESNERFVSYGMTFMVQNVSFVLGESYVFEFSVSNHHTARTNTCWLFHYSCCRRRKRQFLIKDQERLCRCEKGKRRRSVMIFRSPPRNDNITCVIHLYIVELSKLTKQSVQGKRGKRTGLWLR